MIVENICCQGSVFGYEFYFRSKESPKNSETPITQEQLAKDMGMSVDTLQNYKMLADMIPELDILSIYFKLQRVFHKKLIKLYKIFIKLIKQI